MAEILSQRLPGPPPPTPMGATFGVDFRSSSHSRSSTSSTTSRSSTPFRGAPASDHHGSSPMNKPKAHSAQSSLSSVKERHVPPQQHLRSQYPANGAENHVEYILVASFDIDRGSVMEHQYPGPISGDENMLAELMLPDQAHMRNQDWTIFFLHKDTTAEDEAREERRDKRRRRRDREAGIVEDVSDGDTQAGADAGDPDADDGEDLGNTDEEEEDELEGPPLIYVLNLVNTKQDNTVKRGAIVKAMAICTRHSFLHIYKPLLLLALEEYFRVPVPETLAHLYHAVNSMDLSLMPRLSQLERHILQASDAKDMFVEKFEQMIKQRMAADRERNSVESSHTENSQIQQQRYMLPRDTHEFESRVYYNNIPVPIKIPTATSPETVGDFSLIKLIQTFSTPHTTAPQPFPLHPHLTTSGPFTHPIIVLVNALLTQKRIIFLGHNQPSGSVAEAVLAACALASGGGILKGFTRHAFPYTDLTKIDDLLKVPGFIAGVTNPAFAHKAEWWDVLCDLPTGRIKISTKIEPAAPSEGVAYFAALNPSGSKHSRGDSHSYSSNPSLTSSSSSSSNPAPTLSTSASFSNISGGSTPADPTGDAHFITYLLDTIASRLGEQALRLKVRAHILRFTRIAAAFEETVYGASALYVGADETDSDAFNYGVAGHGYVWPSEDVKMRELAAHAARVEGWRVTRSYFGCVADLARGFTKSVESSASPINTSGATTPKGAVVAPVGTAGGGGGGGSEIVGVRGLDLRYHIDRLRGLKLGNDQSAAVYTALYTAIETAGIPSPLSSLDDVAPPLTPAEQADLDARRERARYGIILHLLVVTPESQGGLFYLSLGLWHKRPEVRRMVRRVLERVRENEAGRHYWGALGRFAKVGFWRGEEREGG
ncbi:spindle pole body interacting protein [Aulographum hederae CBS 113979]|uniref:Spindle pole body interacting protein n=1 Tax=Aulographum hederae CBS 113979 TaxID=1176131 RepID=A0A6G1GT84_9PEZI|nr:spindle pole body interacting protein [Aulographum hederae CBS 113979]